MPLRVCPSQNFARFLQRRLFDLDNAPRNERGNVEFSADNVILKPLFRRLGNNAVFFEVNNRGNKISHQMMNDTPPDANNNDPTTMHDFGNGWLERQGASGTSVPAWITTEA